MKNYLSVVCAFAVVLSGCATSQKVERVKVGDNELTCTQLLAQIEEADKFKKSAEENKGATGTNVAAVLLFWPAIFATYSDANEAIRASDDRKANLTKLYNDKKCTGEIPNQAATSAEVNK